METMKHRPKRQPALVGTFDLKRVRITCTTCRRELTDPVSRLRRLGPECDPEPRNGQGPDHHVDQDPLPGT